MIDHVKSETARGQILIVDDFPANLQLLRELLMGQGYAVRAASSGRLALRSVAAKAPQLIVLDVKMPEMDGFEVCRRLKADERSREIPVIFISALDETIDKVKGFEAGGVDYINKPFQPEEVLARIGVQLRIRELTEKLRAANATLEERVKQRTAQLAKTNAELEVEITERTKVQEALRESEKRFRSIFFATATPMVILSPTGAFHQVNPAARRFFGYTEEEFSRLNVLEVTHPEDRPKTSALYDEALAGQREDAVYEKRYRCKDGTIRWGHTSMTSVTDEQGQIKYFVALTQDITERKQVEETARTALAEAEEAREKIDAIIKSVADGLLVTDLSGRVALMNRAAEQLLDVTLGEAFSRPVGSLPPGKMLEDQVAEVISGKGQNLSFEWQLEDAPAAPQIIQALTSQVRNSKGKETGTITILRDLTRERELDRMKNEFISTAAHELRTPLTSVMGFAEVLLRQEEFGVSDPAIQRELLTTIHQKAGRLEGIISDLLDLGRIQSGQAIPLKKAPCNVGDLIKGVVSLYQQGAETHRLEVCLPDEPIELCADRDKLEQVLENLIDNAIKFSPRGGRVRVSGQSDSNDIKLTIEDEGIGMNPEQVEKVFDRFYRVDASSTAAEGLGLGMSIAKAIIESHGGEIQVESEPGKGTKVSVTLPLQDTPP